MCITSKTHYSKPNAPLNVYLQVTKCYQMCTYKLPNVFPKKILKKVTK